MNSYGSFEITIGVPEDYDGHRCKYARKVLRDAFGEEFITALVIQRTIPVDPVDAVEGKTYYEFGGNVKLPRIENLTPVEAENLRQL
jgi:hypothetical protein